MTSVNRPFSQALTTLTGFTLQRNTCLFQREGVLAKYNRSGWNFENRTALISGVPSGNHQTNAINALPNGTLIWHSGSTCNVCEEKDERNAALLWGEPNQWRSWRSCVPVSAIPLTVCGSMGQAMCSVTTAGTGKAIHPREELNMLVGGAAYGWPDDDPDHPIPEGTLAPVATWTPHTSLKRPCFAAKWLICPGPECQWFGRVYALWDCVRLMEHTSSPRS